MFWFLPALFLLLSYISMGIWFFWHQRNSGMSFFVRLLFWLASPLWVVVDWALDVIPPFEQFMWRWKKSRLNKNEKDTN